MYILVGLTFLIFIYIINYLYEFYSKLKTYPPGPLPVPVLGNLITIIWKRNLHPYLAIHECCKPYGKVTTFWFGSRPAVIIHNLDIARNYVFNKTECSGKPINPINALGFRFYALENYSQELIFLRKLSIEAIRHLLSKNKLSSLINESVNDVITAIKTNEKNRPFSPDLYMPHITLRTMVGLVFGQKYNFGDKQLNLLHSYLLAISDEAIKLGAMEFIPILKYFLRTNKLNVSKIRELHAFTHTCFEKCKLEYSSELCDTNFTNSLMKTLLKMIAEEKSDFNYLSDENLKNVLLTLFIGATETTIDTFKWLLIILSHYTEIQTRLRDEVNSVLGTSLPDIEHKDKFHYLNAFIYEVLRFRPISPLGIFRKTLNNFSIGEYSIPKDTILIPDIYAVLSESIYWTQPEKFIPERFLDSSGLFITNRITAFVPFGFGKRMCVGEKLALDNLFITLVCLLQATVGYQIVLENSPKAGDLDWYWSMSATPQPLPFKIILKPN